MGSESYYSTLHSTLYALRSTLYAQHHHHRPEVKHEERIIMSIVNLYTLFRHRSKMHLRLKCAFSISRCHRCCLYHHRRCHFSPISDSNPGSNHVLLEHYVCRKTILRRTRFHFASRHCLRLSPFQNGWCFDEHDAIPSPWMSVFCFALNWIVHPCVCLIRNSGLES